MRRILLALTLLALLSPHALSQTDATRPAPKPFDAFGDVVYETEWLARLDALAVEMNNNPQTKLYIVAYGVPNRLPGRPLRRANWAYGVLTKGRGLDPTRVEVVFGGYRDDVKYEHWLIPPGEELPVKPFDFAAALTREKSAYRFDLFSLYDPASDADYDGSYGEYLDDRGRYQPLALALRQDPAARGLIIVYRSRRNRVGEDRRLAANIKRSILKAHALAPERVVAIGGGRREFRNVEVWLVPPGASLPKPTPDTRPTPRKKR